MTLAKFVATTSLPYAVYAADSEALPDPAVPEEQVALQCENDLKGIGGELADAGFGALVPGGYGPGYSGYGYGGIGTPRQQMQSLRDAADVYVVDGNEEACQMVLASMRQIYEEHDELIGLEADDPEVRMVWRRAHLAKAVPVTGMDWLMRADVVIGADLRRPEDATLGEIRDVVLDPQRQTIAYVLVSRGGFLGMGEELVAVRWTDLRATDDHEIYVLDTSPDAFKASPQDQAEKLRGELRRGLAQQPRSVLGRRCRQAVSQTVAGEAAYSSRRTIQPIASNKRARQPRRRQAARVTSAASARSIRY